MTRAASSWPKAYIIDIYAKAVEHGFVWVQPLTEEKAISLSKSFYNARRRSDSTNKSWMRDEYHLCTFGRWEPLRDERTGDFAPDGAGRVPVLFSALPDGQQLPDIIPAKPGEAVGRIEVSSGLPTSTTEPQDFLPPPPSAADIAANLSLGDGFDAASFVSRMRKKIEE